MKGRIGKRVHKKAIPKARKSSVKPKIKAAGKPKAARSGASLKLRELLRDMPLDSVMTSKVVTVAPELSVERLAELFIEQDISGAPVVDADGKVVGIVSKTDLVRDILEPDDRYETQGEERLQARQRRGVMADLGSGFHEEAIARHTVGEIMTPVAVTIPRSASVGRAAALMVRQGIHRIPVMEGKKKVAGIFSAMDLLRWIVA